MRILPKDSDIAWTPYAWLIYIIPFALTPFYETRGSGLAVFLAMAVFLPIYFRSFWSCGRERLIIIAALTLLGVACWPWSNGAGAFFIYAASCAGQLQKRPYPVVGLIALIVLIEAKLVGHSLIAAAWPFIFVLVVGGINAHYAQVGRANARLRMAQDEIEHLAKVAERERIARDLHDLLGHTLSIIILKSELASKLADRDPQRARDEIRDVERISREALAEVRAAVRGYRSGGLSAEADAAKKALESAGVTFDAQLDAVALTPAQEAVLALAIREAVTNVVRHANARSCRLTLRHEDGAVLTVSDDGRGGTAAFGSGLLGMRERVEALGGTLVHDGRNGTTLTIRLPQASTALRESA
ncbi:MAG TPA: sensor histidine kinase [Thermoanaerobaculia bacterium]|nr:sensor histidine kinase [Thermoanaerobaculia bacterium]